MNRFTLWGAWQYDPTLFDDVVVPDSIDKDDLVDCIMKECGDLKPYYQNPTFLKRNITRWFKRMYWNIDRMMEAFTAEFSPIENYDRYEERHTSESEYSAGSESAFAYNSMSTSLSESEFNSLSASGSEFMSESASDSAFSSEVAKHDVSAFNESGYSPASRDTTDRDNKSKNAHTSASNNLNASNEKSGHTQSGYQSGGDMSKRLNDENRLHYYDEEAHLHGNIGITRADEMIRSTMEMYEDIDVYNLISHMFEKEFLVQVY